MKRFFTFFVTAIILCVTAITFQSCGEENRKYTVWTDSSTYSEFVNAYNTTLEDGHYKRVEIDQKTWEIISKSLTNEGKHRWDEATIKKWLFSNGFGEYESTKEASWFALVDHGFLVTRTDNIVYYILK